MRKFYSTLFQSLLVVLAAVFSNAVLAADTSVKSGPISHFPDYPVVNYGAGAKAQLIKKGEYLVELGDCVACHTAATSNAKPFAGGLLIGTPFGNLYTQNLTPDKTTGIGTWSEKQFIKAMHDGIGPQGALHYYYPAFPYRYFNTVTESDLKAIYAYLQAIPAVQQENTPDTMSWPFSMRVLQFGWRLLFFDFQKTGFYEYDKQHTAAWNRGKYIVDGLGHCSMCHTPSYNLFSTKYPLAAPKSKYYLTGSVIAGYGAAPNINAARMKDVTIDEFKKVFRKDKFIGGGDITGLMKEVNFHSMRHASDEDIQAILTYLKTVDTKAPVVAAPSGSAKSDKNAEGAKIYTTHCALCHTSGAGGAPKLGSSADWAPRLKAGIDVLYKNAYNGIRGMPAKGMCTQCTKAQIDAAVDYMVADEEKGAKK